MLLMMCLMIFLMTSPKMYRRTNLKWWKKMTCLRISLKMSLKMSLN